MKKSIAALALVALLVVAAPAAAKPKTYYYDGKTVDGQSLSFSLTGKRISDIDGTLLATCTPTHGSSLPLLTYFTPPGSFVLGKTRKVSDVEFISYKGDVTKNYTVSVRKVKGRVWSADLHVNYSYEEVVPVGPGELDQSFYICQADDEFLFRI